MSHTGGVAKWAEPLPGSRYEPPWVGILSRLGQIPKPLSFNDEPTVAVFRRPEFKSSQQSQQVNRHQGAEPQMAQYVIGQGNTEVSWNLETSIAIIDIAEPGQQVRVCDRARSQRLASLQNLWGLCLPRKY